MKTVLKSMKLLEWILNLGKRTRGREQVHSCCACGGQLIVCCVPIDGRGFASVERLECSCGSIPKSDERLNGCGTCGAELQTVTFVPDPGTLADCSLVCLKCQTPAAVPNWIEGL